MSFRLDLDRIDRRRLVGGLVLIGIGLLGLFGSFGWLRGLSGLVGTALFGAAAYFAYLQGRHTGALLWRAAAFPLAGLAIASIAPGGLGGFAFLGAFGLAFLLVYRDDAARWWAVIPGGVLLSLAFTALVDGATRSAGVGGAVFLFGLAATFFVLTRLPRHAQSWGIYPAAVLAVLAVVSLTTSGSWIVPLALIAAGAWMLLRPGGLGGAMSVLRSDVPSAPTQPSAGAAVTPPVETAATTGTPTAPAQPGIDPAADAGAEPKTDAPPR